VSALGSNSMSRHPEHASVDVLDAANPLSRPAAESVEV